MKTVGVFVNEDMGKITQLCSLEIIDAVQLHGDEDGNYITKLKMKTGLPIIKAVRVRTKQDILDAEQLPSDYLLLDSYKENKYGGTGKAFDWSLIPPKTERKKPVFLAGGINRDNLLNVVQTADPYCIDISSGVETNGIKDEIKIKEIIEVVRALDS